MDATAVLVMLKYGILLVLTVSGAAGFMWVNKQFNPDNNLITTILICGTIAQYVFVAYIYAALAVVVP